MSKDMIEMVIDEVEETKQQIAVHQENKLEVKREILDWGQLMEMSEMLAKSTIVPQQYQRRPENVMVALDMASRMGVSPMVVMQNLHIIQGKPSWSGTAVASLIRNSGQFKNVELVYVGEEGTDSHGAYVQAERNGKILKGTVVTIRMAKQEGWYQKNGSKWQTMATQMLGYRAYSYFGRLYAPELMMGLHSTDEVEDMISNKSDVINPYEK